MLYASEARAQNMIHVTVSPTDSVGSVPASPGTGLTGLYYPDPAGGSGLSASYSNPLASFTTTNLCFPDCRSGNIFDDNSGGLVAFTNGNATNIVNLSGTSLPNNWNSDALFMNGYLAITQPGTYSFELLTDNDSELFIGSQFLGGVQGCCGPVFEQADFSAPGLYPIVFGFIEYGGRSGLDFIGTDPSGACYFGCYDANGNLQPNGLFYSNSDLSGAPAPALGTGWPSFAVTLGILAFAGYRTSRRTVRIAAPR